MNRSHTRAGERFDNILDRRINRRSLVKGAAAVSAVAAGAQLTGAASLAQDATPMASPTAAMNHLTFEAIAGDAGEAVVVAAGYTAVPFLPWGTPIKPDAPAFDYTALTGAAQAMQVGYNHDYVGFFPLPLGSDSSENGILVFNHEYTNPELMFAGYLTANPDYVEGSEDTPEFLTNPTKEIVDVELEAHGVTIVEVIKGESGAWELVLDSPYNRRLTGTTPFEVVGPAAGHALLQTSVDSTGTQVSGTLNNCSAGLTPWGTVLTTEENFHQYFANLDGLAEDDPVRAIHDRYGLPGGSSERRWEEFYDRFDITKEPNESFRFGWLIEVDPYDPESTPVKQTAHGRFRHENTNTVIATGGQAVVYSGDDERFEYVYKFVSNGTFNPDDRAANMTLVADGILYVAVFNDDGTGEWKALTFGENGIDESNGFASQADVMINARTAADLLGATMMDRPEDIETSPLNGKVYMIMTNNTQRGPDGRADVDAANPRVENAHGHILEVTEDGGDHAATTFTWEMFILGGPADDETSYYAGFPKEMVSPLSCPDNSTFDNLGGFWISTDGSPRTLGINDGLYAVPVDGEERGYVKQFMSSVPGAEVSGPIFTPDNTTLFVAIQHPGEGGTFEEPAVRWPDPEGPARPALVVFQKDDGGVIGT